MRRAVPFLLILAALPGCGSRADAPVTVEGAQVVLPVLPDRPGAAYFTVRASSGEQRLVAVTSPQAGRIELHETRTENGVARMAPIADARATAQAPLVFAQGGRHAMLFDIAPAVRAGTSVQLVFRFEPGGEVIVPADVRAFGAEQGGGHDEGHEGR